MQINVAVDAAMSTRSKVISYSGAITLLVILIYLLIAQIDQQRFQVSNCSFQGIRTPNAETRILREAASYMALAKNDQQAYDQRMRIGESGYAQAFQDREAIEKSVARSDLDFVKATYSLYLAGCGPTPTPPPSLRYVTAPPR